MKIFFKAVNIQIFYYSIKNPLQNREFLIHHLKNFNKGSIFFYTDINKLINISRNKIVYSSHHLSHCLYGLSVIKNVSDYVYVTCDGVGEGETMSIYTIDNDYKIINGNKYSKDNSYIIPMNQPKRTLIKGMFNTQTKFQDSLFYDVSAWTFPLAFNINYDYTDGLSQTNISKLIDNQVDNLTKPNGFVDAKSEYAYIFEPHEYYTQAAIYKILDHGLRVKTATRKFSINGKKYDYGTYMIQVQNQN